MQSPVLIALGWILLNSCWQFALAWLLYRFLLRILPGMSASSRHRIALAIFAGTLLAGTFFSVYVNSSENTSLFVSLLPADWQRIPAWSDLVTSAISFIWMICMLVQTARIVWQRRAFVQDKGSLLPIHGQLKLYVKETAALLGVHRPVSVVLAAKALTVQVSGWLKPMIILPLATLNSLSTAQMEAVLLHELVHIRQHDYLINVLLSVCEWLFFFNPFLRLFTQAIRREREFRCDDMVLQFRYQAGDYAAALLVLARNQSGKDAHAIAVTGNGEQQLLLRVQRMLGLPQRPAKRRYTGAVLMLAVSALLILYRGPHPVRSAALPPVLLPVLADKTQTPFTGPSSKELTITLQQPAHASKAPAPVQNRRNSNPAEKVTFDEHTILFTAETDSRNALADVLNASTSKEIEYTIQSDLSPLAAASPLTTSSIEKPYVQAESFVYGLVKDDTAMQTSQRGNETVAGFGPANAEPKRIKLLSPAEKEILQRELRYSNTDLARLQSQIAAISSQMERVQPPAYTEQPDVMRKAMQAFQLLQRELAEKEQLIRILQERLDKASKDYLEQAKQLQRAYKLRRIIYI